nr:reverse transcriptase domain-containing protein [Tanacetum cinerariifolium]
MQARSFSRLISDQSSNPTSSTNPKGRNRRRSKQRIKNSNLEEHSHPVVTMADQRTMAELLRAPTEGYKDLLRACPHYDFTELHQLDTLYNALNPADQDSLNAAAGENLLERSTQEIAKLTHAVNQQTSVVTNAMAAMLKQFQATPFPALVKLLRKLVLLAEGRDLSLATPLLTRRVNSKPSPLTVVLLLMDPPFLLLPQSINPEVDEHVEETFTDPDLAEFTIKIPPPPVQKYKPPSQREFVVHKRDPLYPNIPYPSRMLKQKQQEKDEKMLKALMSNKEKLQELTNTPLNKNCSVVILKKLPKKLGDPGKFLIPCGFSELKCKALADLGASINLMPLSVWKKLALPELIPTRMTLELANRVICTPAGIARDVFVPVGKFTFPADFVIVDYESDPRVPLILGRPFLRTARALIDFHGEEMILHDGEDFLEDLFPSQSSGNPTFSLHLELTLPEVNNNIFDSEGCNVLSKKLLDLHPPLHDNPLSGSTTYFSNLLLEEFADELPLKYNDNLRFDIESYLKEIEFLLYQDKDSSLKDLIDQTDLANLADIFVDSVPEMFTDEHALDYSSPPIFDEYDDDFLEVESDAGNVYDDPFDSKGEKIKESKLLIAKLDLLCDFLPPSEYDSFISQDFFKVNALPSINNEDKIFNPGILIQGKPVEIITRVVQDKKLAISNASLVFEDFDHPFYEPLFFKEVPKSKMLLPFSYKNEEKVFKPGIHTSEKVHSYFIPELSHQGYKVFKINQIFKSLMQNFLFYCGKDTHILAVPYYHFYPLDQFKYGGIGSSSAT